MSDLEEAYVKIKEDEFIYFKSKIDDIQKYWVGVLLSAKKEQDELLNAPFKDRFKEWFFNRIEHRIERARDMVYLWENKRKWFNTDRDIYIDILAWIEKCKRNKLAFKNLQHGNIIVIEDDVVEEIKHIYQRKIKILESIDTPTYS